MTIFQGKDGELRITDGHQDSTNYLTVRFRNLDLSSQLGRPALEERLVLDGGKVNGCAHYVTGNDMVIFDPFALSFSFMADDTCNVDPLGTGRDLVYQALICRNADNFGSTTQTWAGYGNSTKGTTQNKAGIYNPVFRTKINDTPYASGTITSIVGTDEVLISESYSMNYLAKGIAKFTSGTLEGEEVLINFDEPDSNTLVGFESDITGDLISGDTFDVYDNYRTVDIQYKIDNGLGTPIVWKFNEVYFPPNEITLAESEEALTVTATGGVYGTVQRGTDWFI